MKEMRSQNWRKILSKLDERHHNTKAGETAYESKIGSTLETSGKSAPTHQFELACIDSSPAAKINQSPILSSATIDQEGIMRSKLFVNRAHYTVASAAIALLCLAVASGRSTALAQNLENPVSTRHVRAIEVRQYGVLSPVGLSYSPNANIFHVISGRGPGRPVPHATDLYLLTPTDEFAGIARIAAQVKDPINTAFDLSRNRLLILHTPADQLIEVQAGPDGVLDAETLRHHKIGHFGAENPQGITIDQSTGDLFILDANGPQLIRVAVDLDGGYANAIVSRIALRLLGISDSRGLASDPSTGHLHILSPSTGTLYEITSAGQLVSTRDLSQFGLNDPQGFVFAPSGDLTDDPARMSLYVVDSGPGTGTPETKLQDPEAPASMGEPDIYIPHFMNLSGGGGADEAINASEADGGSGQIVELTFAQPQTSEISTLSATLVRPPIDTWQWSPPSPDASGIAYLAATNSFLVSDSEVNEIPGLYTGDNLFQMNPSGSLIDTLTTASFSDEPAGVAYNPANQHLFFSDDTGKRSIYELNPGPDDLYNTSDDIVSSFSTGLFGSLDPEGLTFDPVKGVLYIADGMNREVYRVAPGTNGVFDGVMPDGDDQVTSFDTSILGIQEPEGIAVESNGRSLYIVDKVERLLTHVTNRGQFLRAFDLFQADPSAPSGIAIGPSSVNPSEMNLYIVDRGFDNDFDPNENDGRVYEVSVPKLTPRNTPPMVEAGADQVISLPEPAALDGTLVVDDGVPNPATTAWTQVSGPGSVIFAVANAQDTSATFSLPGTYVLRLTATDGELAGGDEVTITVTGVADVSTIDIGIAGTDTDNPAASSDDVEEVDNTESSLTALSPDLDMFDDGKEKTNNFIGLRFNGVHIPSGAKITHAYVQFWTDEPDSTPTSLVIQGQAADNPSTFSVSAKVGIRPLTSATVPWSPPTWQSVGDGKVAQRTPNIASIIQEIVDRSGWSDGNSLVIILSGSGERTAISYEGDPKQAPHLHVEYAVNKPPIVDAGPNKTILLSSRPLPLDGTVDDDEFLGPITTTWAQISGPATVSFEDTAAVDTKASFPVLGTYILRLRANDGEFIVSDRVTINVAIPGTIHISQATKPKGGTGFNFSGQLGPFTLNDGETNSHSNLVPGTYSVIADDPASLGYKLSDLTCRDSDNSGQRSSVDVATRTALIKLDPGETVTCTFTNRKVSSNVYLPIFSH